VLWRFLGCAVLCWHCVCGRNRCQTVNFESHCCLSCCYHVGIDCSGLSFVSSFSFLRFQTRLEEHEDVLRSQFEERERELVELNQLTARRLAQAESKFAAQQASKLIPGTSLHTHTHSVWHDYVCVCCCWPLYKLSLSLSFSTY
jgi:hypothetical protein